ncbi:UDP-glucose 4-epimerase GalE [Variovorax dokdonensis]|uniref:UDP-glucose 4-epimerase n=1 Tax=Variovorax dokdonensis TaxID=344883 RepID=A0ABT7NB44_9BURK|nr:UDP-glucose 4-epimerase GalE [Variovorax dokdonensis]MDM0045165.1 UDP-glucose 4-epimerase GalE [Variovorax dokdonensis]
MKNYVLVTGGAGYIGSHTCVALAAAGYTPLILDNLCNSSPKVFERLARIVGGPPPRAIEGDIRDRQFLDRLFAENAIDAVIHFAGLKAVGDSVADPLSYYDNNVNGSMVLAAAMQSAGVKTLVFSSSATVYGEPERTPIPEAAPCWATNPYGRTKLMVEQMLTDLHSADPGWNIGLLRYFNPAGAHESGLIGEHPKGKPNNLMPFVSQVAVGTREYLTVHGNDYPTIDGTGVRDYIHVLDLAEGHVAALRHAKARAGLFAVNLGTGAGASVLEVITAFEKASGRKVAYKIGPRRTGDVPASVADTSLARSLLGWQAQRGLNQMCVDSWRWQQANPNGYDD